MEAPQYQPPPVDPAFEQLKAKAKQDDILAAQERIRGDSASLMARYGTMLAMGNAGIPAVTPSTPGAMSPLRPGRAA